MPAILALLRGLALMLPTLGLQLLTTLGVGTATYLGVGAVFDAALDGIQTQIAELSPEIIQLIGVARIDDAFKLIFSAMAVRLALRGMNSLGAIRRWNITPPAA